MKKLTVLCTHGDADKLVRRLMKLRCVEITQDRQSRAVGSADVEVDCAAREKSLLLTGEAVKLLTPYSSRPKSFFKKKHSADLTCGDTGVAYAAALRLRDETLRTRDELAACRTEAERNREKQQTLEPWTAYDLPLSDTATRCTETVLGSVPSSMPYSQLENEFEQAGAEPELLGTDKANYYLFVLMPKEGAERIRMLMNRVGFVRANLNEFADAPAVELQRLRERLDCLEGEEARLITALRTYAERLDELEILYDTEATALTALRQQAKLETTDYCVQLTGWVPTPRADTVAEMLNYMDCAYSFDDPADGEEAPILLKNNKFSKTFEWVIGMYAYPQYGRFDPTFVMSLFYFVIFGIMFADVGYGLLLVLGGFIGAKLVGKKAGLHNMLMMFGYCGISCVIMGVLFGAYFGDLPLAVMRNMMGIAEADLPNLALIRTDSPTLAIFMDPVGSPMEFLIVSLAIGAVHLIGGMAVKFYILCRDGQVWDAICDILFYWILFAGIGCMALGLGWYVLAAGVVLIVLTHGRNEKNIVMKFAKGLLGLYDLVSYASDLLSYSRILALGLAAGVVAQVVNILATIGGATVPGFILLVVVGIFGHLLNLALNVLGTFVHTSRLQYIEFFGKFYEDGGKPFAAALPSEKYTEDENESNLV